MLMYHGADIKCINWWNMDFTYVENLPASSRQHKDVTFFSVTIAVLPHFIFVLVRGYLVRLFGRLLMVPTCQAFL